MKGFKFPLPPSMSWIAVLMALLFVGADRVAGRIVQSSRPTHRSVLSAADADAQGGRLAQRAPTRPALRARHQLRLRHRDHDQTGDWPAWSSFSGAQQAAVRDAFAHFLVADYAHQVSDYSGESFVVDPQTSPESRGGGEIVKTQLVQPGGRTVQINYLVRGGRVVDVYLNGTVSDLATRRDEFASILAGGGGADALVKTLRERTETLLGS